MKKIKVHLQYPWSFPDSSYYKSILKYPPKNVEFVNFKQEEFKGISSGKKFKRINKIKNLLRKVLYVLKLPNIIKTKKTNFDIIHCAHCLSKNKKPWVVDVEHYWNFASSGKLAYSKQGKEKIKKFLKSPYCKKILPWTESAKKSITDALKDKEIEKKIEIVSFAMPVKKFKKKKGKTTLLFVGRYFYAKGGMEALEAFDELSKNQDIKCIFVSDTPKQILEKYSKNKRIEFYNLMPQEKLFELYKKSDIFVYPGYSDTFGFALVEAMAFGLATVTVNGFARKEIVKNGKTGYVIETKANPQKSKEERKRLVKEIVFITTKLIKNKKLLLNIQKNAKREIKNGKFSIEKRNKKLEEVYKEALK